MIAKVNIFVKVNPDLYSSIIVRNIIEGRVDESFTGHLTKSGKFKKKQAKEFFYLFARTVEFVRFIKNITSGIKLSKSFNVYRALNSKSLDAFPHFIPFSATWDIDFAVSWLTKPCCILEIEVDFVTFLPLSTIKNTRCKLKGLNQDQYEIVFPPCKFKQIGLYEYKSINVIRVKAYRMTSAEVLSFYPIQVKEYILQLNSQRERDEFINEMLTESFGGML